MPSQRTLQKGHHRTMPDLARPQVGEAVLCGLVRRHTASLPGIYGERPQFAGPRHTRASPTETYFSARILTGRPLHAPRATPACAPAEPSERGGRSSGRLSGTATTTPNRRSLTGGT